MRRLLILSAAAFAMTATAMPAPVFAQDGEGSNTRKVLGRILNAVLGPEEQDEAEETVVMSKADGQLAAVLTHERRADDVARDQYRNPAATLNFFQVQPDHHVVEYAPGGGWYTRILAPYVADAGSYTAVSFPPAAGASLGENFVARVRQGGETFSATQSQALGIPAEKLPFYFGDQVPEATHGTVDRVLIIRMLHNLVRWGVADTELMTLRKMLKDDGLVGIVQHRAPESHPWSMTDGNRGYLQKSDVVALMELYGFELVAESEINANPNDQADYPAGVWTLPPSFGFGQQSEEEQAKHRAIGETDRMTLLFKKAD